MVNHPNRAMTKAAVMAWGEANQVEISVEKWSGGITHVHANCEPGRYFKAHGVHNLGLFDDAGRVPWASIMRELQSADLQPCTKPDCEYCHDDEE